MPTNIATWAARRLTLDAERPSAVFEGMTARRDRLDKLASELKEGGADAEVIAADLSRPEGVAAVVERLEKGDISLLVNNAGFGTNGEFTQLPIDRELQEIDLNIRALTQLTHVGLAKMKQSGGSAHVT